MGPTGYPSKPKTHCGLKNWTQNPTHLRVGLGWVLGPAVYGEVYKGVTAPEHVDATYYLHQLVFLLFLVGTFTRSCLY